MPFTVVYIGNIFLTKRVAVEIFIGLEGCGLHHDRLEVLPSTKKYFQL